MVNRLQINFKQRFCQMKLWRPLINLLIDWPIYILLLIGCYFAIQVSKHYLQTFLLSLDKNNSNCGGGVQFKLIYSHR